MAVWRTRLVFVSSTFRDMQEERDYLREHVFPELGERLQARRHRLEPIDLRWGVETVSVDEEHSKELLVLKVVLAEIERSRPFLIALIGDRYGWIPPEERMRAAVDEQGFATDVGGKSVTALEIEFGVLESPEQRSRSFFYFRKPLPYGQMDPETAALYSDAHNAHPDAAEAAQRLVDLKTRIERELPDRVRHYVTGWDSARSKVTDLEALGRMVLEDIWRELDHETETFVQQPDPSWQEQERWALEEFVEHRARGFVGREETLATLRALALSPAGTAGTVPSEASPRAQTGLSPLDWGASVTGESGTGKSALFAQLHRIFENKDVLLLAHAAGISLRANQVDGMLLRWIEELATFLGVAVPVEKDAKPDDIDAAFRAMLTQASQRKRVVVLVDALNQFEPTPRARYVTWLPKLWPENARLITTAIPGTASEAFEQRPGALSINVPLLSTIEADAIVRSICRRYHREVNPEVLGVLTAKQLAGGAPAAGNPLWLTLAVEELNLLDADDFARADREFTGTPEQRLHQMLLDVAGRLPADVPGLYGWMLSHTEELYGEAWARTFANLVAVSRAGWRESDFEALLPRITGEAWDPLRFAGLRRSFRAQLVQRGAQGQWDFFHIQMRQAVLARNLSSEDERKALHSHIADHLEAVPREDPLRETELMHHLIGADDKARAAHYYGGDLLPGEKTGASQALADHILADAEQDPNPGLEWALALIRGGHVRDIEARVCKAMLCNHYLFDLNACLANRTTLVIFAELFNATLEALTTLVAQYPPITDWQRDLSVSHAKVGDVLGSQGDAAGALEAYRKALAISEQVAAQEPSNTEWRRDLSVSHVKVGDALRSQGDAAGALEAYRKALAISEGLLAQEPTNALLQRDLLVARERTHITLPQEDAGSVLCTCQNTLAIRERQTTQDPANVQLQRDLSINYELDGERLLKQGDATGALVQYRKALAICEQMAGRDPSNSEWQHDLSISQGKVGDVLAELGDMVDALRAYHGSLTKSNQLAAMDPSNATWQHSLAVAFNKLGLQYKRVGDVQEGELYLRQCLKVLQGMRRTKMQMDEAAANLFFQLSRYDKPQRLKALSLLLASLTTTAALTIASIAVSPWIWFLAAPTSTITTIVVVVQILKLRGIFGVIRCPECEERAIQWRKKVFCPKCREV